jgi:hypothetical protein
MTERQTLQFTRHKISGILVGTRVKKTGKIPGSELRKRGQFRDAERTQGFE